MNNMYQQMILDHYKNPYNKVTSDVDGYIKKEALNPSCGDMVTIYLKIEDNVIIDIKFKGEGCSICCASSSVMTNELISYNLDDVICRVNKFRDVIKDGESYDGFEDANIFEGIKNFPARFKCAILSWDAVQKMIEEYDE